MPTTTTTTEWGVRHKASPDRTTNVDVRESEDSARRWCRSLHFCGNNDATVVTRTCGPQGTTSWAAPAPRSDVRTFGLEAMAR